MGGADCNPVLKNSGAKASRQCSPLSTLVIWILLLSPESLQLVTGDGSMDGGQVSVEEYLGLVHEGLQNILPKLGCEETPWVCTEEAWFNRLLRPTLLRREGRCSQVLIQDLRFCWEEQTSQTLFISTDTLLFQKQKK